MRQVSEATELTAELTEPGGYDLLIFASGTSRFAVCLDQVTEIAEVDEFARLTAEDPTLRGALVTRGRALPMIDVTRRMGLPPPTKYIAPVLMVTCVGVHEVGFLVDDPEDVVTLRPDRLRPLPPLIERARTSSAVYAVAIHGDRLLLLLDLEALMTEREAAAAAALAQKALSGETE